MCRHIQDNTLIKQGITITDLDQRQDNKRFKIRAIFTAKDKAKGIFYRQEMYLGARHTRALN